MTNPLARLDLGRPVTFTRGTAIMVGVALGIILGGLFVIGARALDRATDARESLAVNQRELAAAVDRLEAIETPTVSRERAAIDRALDRFTRSQLRRLFRSLLDATAPADRRKLRRLATPAPRAGPQRRDPSPPDVGRRRGRPSDPSPGSRRDPSRRRGPRDPSPRPGEDAPPRPTPPAPAPGRPPPLDPPPIDLDGPGGPLPPVDLPPIGLWAIRLAL